MTQDEIIFNKPKSEDDLKESEKGEESSNKQEEEIREENPREKLNKMSEKTQTALASAKTVLFIFQTSISVDLLKVTANVGDFFSGEEVITLPIEEIEDIDLERGIVGTTIRIKYKKSKEPLLVKGLDDQKATEVKQAIIGLKLLIKEGVKLGKLDPEKDRNKILSLGKASGL